MAAAGKGTDSTKTDEQGSIWENWTCLRSELGIPGYWRSLTENCAQWAEETSVCPFWKEFDKRRSAWSNEFYQRTRGPLLAGVELPKFCGKGHDRIRTKIEQFTSGEKTEGERAEKVKEFWPADGPPVPRLNDLVRTRVECQFLDGVEFIGSKLEELGRETSIEVRRHREGRLEGYFAQHLYFDHQVFFRFGGNPQPVTIQCEVQIATQLATRIWHGSHGVYEEWRGRRDAREDWQWNPKDHRFIARQLGHMIHLADGLLVQLRDARSGERT
ncbi:MAG: hypothetical protein V2A79_02120 [Planctomycetota bacterium]